MLYIYLKSYRIIQGATPLQYNYRGGGGGMPPPSFRANVLLLLLLSPSKILI